MLLSERKLVVLCVACSAIGIVALFIIASVAEPLQVSPSDAAKLDVRSGNSPMIKIVGFVDSVFITESHAVVKIAELETVEAVSFDASYIKGIGLKRLQEVEMFGELRQYKGKGSLIISRLRLINSSNIGSVSNIGCGAD
ncbi:hypothetical protein HYV85_02875 [Candidatus Woesearchaeota archaeon]|nr:hypothetical protein [Candidatus Woesearchaeota archaeon]